MDKYLIHNQSIQNTHNLFNINRNTHIGVIKVPNSIITNNGAILHNNTIFHFNKWYHKNNFNKTIYTNFQNHNILSLVQIWNNSFQHITFDTLSKLSFIKDIISQDDTIKILVMNNTQKNIINYFLNIHPNKFIIHTNKSILVKNAYYINSYNINNTNTKMGDFGTNTLANFLIKNNFKYFTNDKPLKNIIYISREGLHKRSFNNITENKFIDMLKNLCCENNYDFYCINKPDNSREFVEKMNNTFLLISIHGGALGNMIYLNKNSNVIEIIDEKSLEERPCYYFLSQSLDIKYNYFVPDKFHFDKNYVEINFDKIKDMIMEIIQK